MNSALIAPAIVSAVAALSYCSYQIWVNPFGWIGRCRHKKTIRFQDSTEIELVRPNEFMCFPSIKDFVGQYGRHVCTVRTIHKIIDEKRMGDIPRSSDGTVRIIAQDTDPWFVQVLTIDEKDTPFRFTSQLDVTYHDSLIAISKTAEIPATTKRAVA